MAIACSQHFTIATLIRFLYQLNSSFEMTLVAVVIFPVSEILFFPIKSHSSDMFNNFVVVFSITMSPMKFIFIFII